MYLGTDGRVELPLLLTCAGSEPLIDMCKSVTNPLSYSVLLGVFLFCFPVRFVA